MSLSQPLVTALQEFGSAFSRPTWSKVQVLIVGTLLARGRRTVTADLSQILGDDAENPAGLEIKRLKRRTVRLA